MRSNLLNAQSEYTDGRGNRRLIERIVPRSAEFPKGKIWYKVTVAKSGSRARVGLLTHSAIDTFSQWATSLILDGKATKALEDPYVRQALCYLKNADGMKLHAVHLARTLSGMSIPEAREFIEGLHEPMPVATGECVSEHVLKAIRATPDPIDQGDLGQCATQPRRRGRPSAAFAYSGGAGA